MDSIKTENLYEDLHWIILIAGYILSDDVSGEKSLIPDEIMMYSIAESENVHLESTVNYLTSLGSTDIGKVIVYIVYWNNNNFSAGNDQKFQVLRNPCFLP